MSSIRWIRVAVVLIAISPLFAAGAQPAAEGNKPSPPSISIVADAVTIGNVSPNADVVLFGVAREPRNHAEAVVSRHVLLHDSGSGTVTYSLAGHPFIHRSAWVAVDLATGLLAMAAPAGAPLRTRAFPGNSLHETTPGKAGRIDLDLNFVEMLLARPRTGAWRMSSWDGGPGDDDRQVNGRLALPFASMIPITAEGVPPSSGAPAPDTVKPGDVLVIIDTRTLDVFAMGGQ
jgi:hypothetical protein